MYIPSLEQNQRGSDFSFDFTYRSWKPFQIFDQTTHPSMESKLAQNPLSRFSTLLRYETKVLKSFDRRKSQLLPSVSLFFLDAFHMP